MKRFDRRRLLIGGGAAGFLAASGASAFAGPRQGGLLRIGVVGAFVDWDTRNGLSPMAQVAGIGTVFDALTEIAPNGSLRGELATAWQAHDGGRQWIFDLRDGVRFHNGMEFGAADVVASFTHHLTGATGRALLHALQGVEAENPRRVRFIFDHPVPDAPLIVADPHLVIYPAAALDQAIAAGIGTGCYRSGRRGPGERLTFWRVDDHYKGDVVAQFTEVELLGYDSAEALEAAWGDGRLHVAQSIGDGFGLRSSADLPVPEQIGTAQPLDDGRIAERWWRKV